uniref:Uncharacterized protein n=1 Tax=Caenorhabditis japonica TaxID=281687 RepID=A0A8R1HUK9_CAEJA
MGQMGSMNGNGVMLDQRQLQQHQMSNQMGQMDRSMQMSGTRSMGQIDQRQAGPPQMNPNHQMVMSPVDQRSMGMSNASMPQMVNSGINSNMAVNVGLNMSNTMGSTINRPVNSGMGAGMGAGLSQPMDSRQSQIDRRIGHINGIEQMGAISNGQMMGSQGMSANSVSSMGLMSGQMGEQPMGVQQHQMTQHHMQQTAQQQQQQHQQQPHQSTSNSGNMQAMSRMQPPQYSPQENARWEQYQRQQAQQQMNQYQSQFQQTPQPLPVQAPPSKPAAKTNTRRKRTVNKAQLDETAAQNHHFQPPPPYGYQQSNMMGNHHMSSGANQSLQHQHQTMMHGGPSGSQAAYSNTKSEMVRTELRNSIQARQQQQAQQQKAKEQQPLEQQHRIQTAASAAVPQQQSAMQRQMQQDPSMMMGMGQGQYGQMNTHPQYLHQQSSSSMTSAMGVQVHPHMGAGQDHMVAPMNNFNTPQQQGQLNQNTPISSVASTSSASSLDFPNEIAFFDMQDPELPVSCDKLEENLKSLTVHDFQILGRCSFDFSNQQTIDFVRQILLM